MRARRWSLSVALVVIAGCLLAGGCRQHGREANNPFAGMDWNREHVGQVDTIPMNGR